MRSLLCKFGLCGWIVHAAASSLRMSLHLTNEGQNPLAHTWHFEE
jgi:hypothetical protein